MMKLTFESADESDIDAIFRLNKEQIDTYENIEIIDYDKVLKWVCQKIHNHICKYVCVFYNIEKVGYYFFHQEDGKMEIDDLYVLPQFRNILRPLFYEKRSYMLSRF